MLLTARETADRLGVKLDTLYAYVSRGRLRSVEIAGTRERRYLADEVASLRAERGAARRTRAPAEALMPVLGSSICLIERHRLYYRGRDALRLAETATLEEIAGLLWGNPDAVRPPTASLTLPRMRGREARGSGRAGADASLGMIERCLIRLAELAEADLAALDLSRASVMRTGRLILGELAGCVAETAPEAAPVHRRLAAAWRLDEPGAELVRRILVLLADHELNASTFVARCVASTGATPYAVVSAALAALSGRYHGGASVRAEALCRELAGGSEPMSLMAARLARDETLPGIGHPLYPDGDPRAVAILDSTKKARPARAGWIDRVAEAAAGLTGQRPNVDFGLGIAATALGLPPGGALGLFIVGRTVGWIGHAIEQYESRVLIRPRARYTGLRPVD